MSNQTTWLKHWAPEDETFWKKMGKSIANRTLIITTANLTLAFIVWFMVSALVVRLPQIGFQLTTGQLFWLAAMPGLAGGTLRLVHMFLTPMFGTRAVVSLSTLLLLIPAIGWFYAVQNPDTPYWVLMVLACLAGLGGGNFSSFMPSTSLFYPKRLQGTALAIQAGIGNFGVSVVQFVTPWIIGAALVGGGLLGSSQTMTKGGVTSQVYLQNAAAIYVPFILVFGVAAWLMLRSVPIKANFREQFDIFGSRHTWSMTSLYIMTFGAFSGLSATFPLLIKQCYGGLEGAPDPLTYAFYGPLVGSVARVAAGPISDRLGGARVTQWAGCWQCLDLQADADDFPATPGRWRDRLHRGDRRLWPAVLRHDVRAGDRSLRNAERGLLLAGILHRHEHRPELVDVCARRRHHTLLILKNGTEQCPISSTG